MRKTAFILIVLFSISPSGSVARATILGVDDCRDGRGVPLPSGHWSFDYDSQLLQVAIFVDDVPGPSDPYLLSVVVTGRQDTQSSLTIVENITNRTGVALTGYKFYLAGTHLYYSEIVPGSIQVTGDPEVREEKHVRFELAWSEPIPPDGAFTIKFDVFNYQPTQGYWGFAMAQSPVPEPSTIALFSLGGLALLRRRSSIKGTRKA